MIYSHAALHRILGNLAQIASGVGWPFLSTALRRETPGIPQSTQQKRKALVDAGVLVPSNDPALYIFSQDASFGSASGASTVIAGRTDNGRQSWRVEGRGASYAQWRDEQIVSDPIVT
jgi:hypothetical protein